jgi:hypothetical protein
MAYFIIQKALLFPTFNFEAEFETNTQLNRAHDMLNVGS